MPKTDPQRQRKTPGNGRVGTALSLVVIGASAGGLEAVSTLLKNLPSNTGMSFFYVQHLSPDRSSNLAQLLSRFTKMKVQNVKTGLRIVPDTVYVCVPNSEIILKGGKIKLSPRSVNELPYLPIDSFFSSTAGAFGESVVGIILSGNATDGTQGLMAIKEAGGLTIAQDSSAKHLSMPKSAIDAGAVDLVLSPAEIARELNRLSQNGFKRAVKKEGPEGFGDEEPYLQEVFKILHRETEVDFSHYKMTTIKRRLHYRMLHCGVSSLKKYVALLAKNKKETNLLYKDLLINVTSFFRDPDNLRYLKSAVLPKLLKGRSPTEPLRVWVPACSTGEEAYSMAMLLVAAQDGRTRKIPVQIFATDLSEQVIRDARVGEYSQSDVAHIPRTYLKRFFTKNGDNYRVVKTLREMCVFAPHNILRDPPFSRIDLISCCNLLIYFDAAAQKKALASLNFALNDNGYLMLGKSETIGTSSPFFAQLNNKYKIYCRKKHNGNRKIPELLPYTRKLKGKDLKTKPASGKKSAALSKELDQVIDNTLLSHYMPACAIITAEMEIIKFRGATSPYLYHSAGNASLNILKMTRPEFVFELRGAIQKALKTKRPVHKPGIEFTTDHISGTVSLEVCPLKIDWDQPLLLVIFSPQEMSEQTEPVRPGKGRYREDVRIKKLAEELNKTRSEMHAVIESQEAAYEDLQAANEEIVSTNEEFQTLNEELETSKEEIEATNEELISTNQELQMRNDLLTESYRYSEAIIATVHEPMLILDANYNVKSANNAFYRKFKVSPAETEGCNLYDLGNKQWNIPKLHELLDDLLSQNIDFKNLEVTHTFPEIGEKIMLLNAHRIIQKTHKEQLILLAIEDITERTLHYQREKELLHKDIRGHEAKKLELEKAVARRTRQLQQKNKELENINKDLTAFSYISSHDLQEPLRKIRNFISVMLDEEKERLSAEGKGYLERAYEVAMRMQALIQDLLIYSRTKNTERKYERTALTPIAEEIRKEFKEALLEKKGAIRTSKLGKATIIPFQFHQLLHNLVSNSLKFSSPGRKPLITVKSELVPGRNLTGLGLSSKVQYNHLIYTDNGIGFDEKYNERVFEVFQRLHSQEEYKGTGMGLAICKRIVENHSGSITAKGKPGKGVRFDIYIPA